MIIADLLVDYRSGQWAPAQMISEWLSRGTADVYANAWIHRADAASLLRRLQALKEQARSASNRRLGLYTNFVNLLDFAACAVPASMRPDGLPFGSLKRP